MRYSAEELYYEQITIRGYKALFTNERIKRDTVPDGWYLYEVRHDDECQGIPCEIAKGILVNFWGSLLMHDKLLFFVKYFSLKKASEFPFFSKGFSLPSAGIMYPCA